MSPWVLQFAPGADNTTAVSAATWNAWTSAVVVGVVAAAAIYQLQQWEEWINALVGIWIGASPWLVGFRDLTSATLNTVIVGALIVCLSGWDLYKNFTRSSGPGQRA